VPHQTLLLLMTLAPIAIILCMLIFLRKAADICGVVGWVAMSIVAYFFFQTSPEVLARSTAAGIINSFPVSLIVATSLLQMALMEKSGALRRVIIFIKTIANDNRAVQIMMINIGFGTLMVSVGATPVSILPPILIAMGYSTYVAIALPAIGYDSLCTYALLGAPIVVFQLTVNRFLGPGHEITLRDAGQVFYKFLPLVSTLIGLSMLWIVGRGKAIRQGLLPCLITGAVIWLVSYFTNQFENLVVLTGVACGIAVIGAMAVYLAATGKKIVDSSRLSSEEVKYANEYPLWKALMPWALLLVLILALNVPRAIFDYLFSWQKLPITGISADPKNPPVTRALWQAYTWILVSTLLAIPFLRPSKAQLADTIKIWLKRAPRPVLAAAIFFAIGEIMGTSGWSMTTMSQANDSMVMVLAKSSAAFFGQAYGWVTSFIGLFGGFITGSEASTIGMFAKYTMGTGKLLGWSLPAMLIITAGLAFGGGLASVISPAKLQNAAASIDKIGEEGKVIRIAFVFSLILTLITTVFVVILLAVNGTK